MKNRIKDFTEIERQVLYNALDAEVASLIHAVEDSSEEEFAAHDREQLRIAKKLRTEVKNG